MLASLEANKQRVMSPSPLAQSQHKDMLNISESGDLGEQVEMAASSLQLQAIASVAALQDFKDTSELGEELFERIQRILL